MLFLSLFPTGLTIETAQLTPEICIKRRQLSDLQLSPDGRLIALTVAEPIEGTEKNRDIWVFDTSSLFR